MNCPYCNSSDIKVIDSREAKDGSTIKRRRECLTCQKRFTTIEKVLKLDLEVVKANGEIEEFNISKIKNSLLKACDKRPITLEQIQKVISSILEDLKKVEETPLPTKIIGKIVLKNLKEFDEIAFLKFAIVHNNYSSMNEFMGEIETLSSFKGLEYSKVK